jgi:formylmethanofuran dehydrogenase subunit E
MRGYFPHCFTTANQFTCPTLKDGGDISALVAFENLSFFSHFAPPVCLGYGRSRFKKTNISVMSDSAKTCVTIGRILCGNNTAQYSAGAQLGFENMIFYFRPKLRLSKSKAPRGKNLKVASGPGSFTTHREKSKDNP